LKWSSAGSAWACGVDNNTTYSGADFALSNQTCSPGWFVTAINGNGFLNCASTPLPNVVVHRHGEAIPPASTVQFDVPCAQDERAISASYDGASEAQPVLAIIPLVDGTPAGDGDTPNGFRFIVKNLLDQAVQGFAGYVICAR
jgi:hypothetical protein